VSVPHLSVCALRDPDRCFPRFGNFIGEEVGSEEASEQGVDARNYVYDDESEAGHVPTGQELMEIDGATPHTAPILSRARLTLLRQMGLRMPLFSTKTSSTTPRLHKSTAKMSKY